HGRELDSTRVRCHGDRTTLREPVERTPGLRLRDFPRLPVHQVLQLETDEARDGPPDTLLAAELLLQGPPIDARGGRVVAPVGERDRVVDETSRTRRRGRRGRTPGPGSRAQDL